jgi:transcriptional regulator with XRE-family HTH domain
MKDIISLTDGFAVRLRELRDHAGWSREQMAEELKIGDVTLWRLEKGRSSPTLAQLEQMQEAGLDVMYLLTGHTGSDLAVINEDKEWGRCALAVSKALAHHGLNPSPATYWRLVRLLYAETLNEAQLKKDMAAALEKAGELALKHLKAT